jgi:two-component system CheB/CheR fusion protein
MLVTEPPESSPSANPAEPLKIVGIGASAGGLEAFTEFVRKLPSGTQLAYVLVQHLDPTHRSLLTELLGRSASLPVQEIAHNTRVEANRIYVIPPNCDLAIEQGVLLLSPRDTKSGPSRTIDNFLKSLAADQGANAIGVILSGAGSDGAQGLKAIKDAGGATFAQDEGSSKYDSMPRSAIGAGCVDFVLPPEKIAEEIARLGISPARTRTRAAANARNRKGRVSRKQTPFGPEPTIAAEWPKSPADKHLRQIFALLRAGTGVDFSVYRINTVRRRLSRRLGVHRLKDLEKYARLLRDNPTEVEALYQDLLIGVTNFYRNPSVFETMKRKIFPKLVKNLPAGEGLRLWVAGCSTGQEAYSYAMAYLEFAEQLPTRPPLQIFATDVNLRCLELARAAMYARPQLAGLNAARIQRFLQPEDGAYRIRKPVRDMVIFAQQNLLTDPPFTRVDLISCRNMLIYIEPALQQRIIPAFHYALKPHGYLVLGASESIGSFGNAFATVARNQKIYQKKPSPAWGRSERPFTPAMLQPPALPALRRPPETPAVDAYREADRLILAKFTPAAVLINESADILQFRGKVQPFLELPAGKASLNLLKLARDQVILPLQRAVRRAQLENRAVREKAVSVDPAHQAVAIEVLPFRSLQSRCFLVIFETLALPAKPAARRAGGRAAPGDRRRLGVLRRELVETREHLDSVREQHETAMEELQASNEEVQSSNEELQSLNEELETSNEELESANEELTTLNEELATRNTELRESEQRLREQADLVELAPLLARSTKDRIIFWNAGAERLYGFTKDEAVGQTSHLLLRAQYPEPLEQLQARLLREGHWEGEVSHRRKDGTELCINAQWVVHKDDQNRVRAVLEIHTDITARRRAERSLREVQELNHRILESTPDCILVLDLAGRLLFANAVAQKVRDQGGLAAGKGAHWAALWSAESRAAAETACRSALAGEYTRFQAVSAGPDQPPRWWDVVLRPIEDSAGHPERLLAVCRDITESRLAEQATAREATLATLRAEVAVEVARGGELVPILQQLSQTIVQHTGAAHVRIWLLDGQATLRLQASAGLYPSLNSLQAQIVSGEGRIGAIAATKRAHISHQVVTDGEIGDPAWARREGITSFAGYPLLFESRVLGVLAVLLRDKPEPRLLRELSLSADAVALLVQRKYAEEEHHRVLFEAMEARNAALAASRAKDDFLATLSHELRTPLNPVLLLASDGAENPEVPPPIRATFETIRNNISLEARLIDDLLDLTRIAHGKLTLELRPVDLHAVLADAVRIVSASADARPCPIILKAEAARSLVNGDAVRLQQVFWNLLINAVKFTPVGGTITVRTSLREKHIVVEVKDTGIGLRDSDIGRIFDPFSQVERRRGGLGLGLAISRQLLEKHGGVIRAVSDGPGKGSTFIVELPLTDSAAPVAREPAAGKAAGGNGRRAENGHRPRLLLVEDHVSTRNTLASLLSRRSFEVVAASTAAEAREKIRLGRFQLVISDLGLPDGDGYSLFAELRAKHPGLIGIALSGYGTEEDLSRSRDAGFLHHITKPVSITGLDEVIDDVLAGTAAPATPAG